MAISETITLKDGVSGPAGKAASAIGKLASSIQALFSINIGSGLGGLADELQKVTIATSEKVQAQALKGQQQAALQSEKLAAADALARNKAMAAVVQEQVKRDSQIAVLEAKANTESEKKAKTHADNLVKIAKDSKAKAGDKGKDASPFQMNTAGQQDATGSFLDGIAKQAPSLESALSSLASAIAGVIETIASKMELLIQKGAQIAVESGTFRENTLIGLTQMLGSASKAQAIYDKALDLADKIGMSKEKVVADITKFMNTGMGESEALSAVKAIGDVTQVLGEQAGNKVANAITRMQALGKTDKAVITSLARSGVSAMEVYQQIAQMTGKKVADVQLAVKKGLIDAKTGVAAIEAVVAKKFGNAAEQAGSTIPRILGDIQDEFARLFDEITSGPGGEAIKGFLKSISDQLTGSGGKELRSAFNDLFGGLGELFGGLFGKGDIKGTIDLIAGGIHGLAGFVRDMTPGVQGFVQGFMTGFRQMAPAIGAVVKVFGQFTSLLFGSSSGLAEKVGRGLAYIIGAFVLLISVIGGVIGALLELVAFVGGMVEVLVALLVDAVTAVVDFFSGLYDKIKGALDFNTAGSTMGADLTNGLVAGITGGISKVVDAIVSMASKAIAAGKAAFQTHSPSKLFENEIGIQVPAGVAQGIAAGTPGVARAVDKMAAVAYGSGTTGLGAPGSTVVPANSNGGGGGSTVVAIQVAAPKVDGGKTPEEAKAAGAAYAQGLMEQLEPALNDYFRKQALQAA